MSKVDALRAMREARYEQTAARAATRAAAPGKAPVKAPVKKAAAKSTEPGGAETPPAAAPAPAAEQLCGHRNMSGRSCTREHGHSAKSHRYS